MNYDQQHLLSWLKKRPLIKISKLEEISDCPKDTIRHFIKERRNLPEGQFRTIEKVLSTYGYTSRTAE